MAGRALLLQGPIGPFFSLLAEELASEGHEVFKIHFNGGDEACYRQGNAQRYTGDLARWPEFLAAFLKSRGIDRILLYGDCRPYHQCAVKVAREFGVVVFVFEEGYVRPDYITLESGGVNGHSTLSHDPATYDKPMFGRPETPKPAGSGLWPVARWAVYYYLAAWRRRRTFPHYRHHRRFNPLREGFCWLRSGWKKFYFKVADRSLNRHLSNRVDRYYLVPLQVFCDAQVRHHSGGFNMESFIARSVQSFAEHAPTDTALVFKHHPMDRAYCHYGRQIRKCALQYGVTGRVKYLHEGHLPSLLKGARGTVTLNSTVGLSSAFHRTPVKTLGYAIYDMPGLTCQSSLDDFWQNPGKVNHRLYRRYRRYLVDHVLGNGSFYRRARSDLGATGVSWPFGSLSATLGFSGSAPQHGHVEQSDQPIVADVDGAAPERAAAAEHSTEVTSGSLIDRPVGGIQSNSVLESRQ